MARSRKLPKNAFAVEPYRDRWLARGADGEPVGVFRRREEAERAVNARREVYEIVTSEKVKTRSHQTASQIAARLHDVAAAGRPKAAQASQGISGGSPILGMASQAATPFRSAEEAAVAGMLTPADLEKALAKQKTPNGSPVSTGRARRSKAPPSVAEGVGEVKRKERKRSTASPAKSRRRSRSERPEAVRGGFVLEDPSAGLSAHDLTKMLAGQLPAQQVQPAAQAANPPAKAANLPAQQERRPRERRTPAAQPAAHPAPTAQGVQAPVAAPVQAPIGQALPRFMPGLPRAYNLKAAVPGVSSPAKAPLSQVAQPPKLAEPERRRRTDKAPPVPKLTMPAERNRPRAPRELDKAEKPTSGGVSLTVLKSALASLFTKLADQIAKKLSAADAKAASSSAAAASSSSSPQTAAAGVSGKVRALRGAYRTAKFAANLFGGGRGAGGGGAGGRAAAGAAGAGGAGGGGAAAGRAGAAAAGGGGGGALAAGAGVAAVAVIVGIELGRLAAKLAKLPHQIEAFTSEILESSRDLRQFNASIANSFAALDRQQLILSGRLASGTSGTARSLAKSEMDLRAALQPQRELLTNIKNTVGTGLNKLGTALATIVNQVLFIEQINDLILKFLGQNKNAARGPQAFMFLDEVSKGRWQMPNNQNPGP